MNSNRKRRFAMLSTLIALSLVIMLGAFAAPASAQDVDNFNTTLTPEDVPTGEESVDQNLTASGDERLAINTSDSEPVNVNIDLSGTPVADALTSDTTVDVTGVDGTTDPGFFGVNEDEGIVFFTGDPDGDAGNQLNVTIELNNLDTTGLSTDTQLEYGVQSSTQQQFSNQPIAKDQIDRAGFSEEFNLAFIEVTDLDNNEDAVVTSIPAAYDQAQVDEINSNVNLDNEVEIRVGGGEYTFSNVTIENDSTTLQPVEGDDVIFIHDNSNNAFFNVSVQGEDVTGAEIRGVTFDFDESASAPSGVNVTGGSAADGTGVDDITLSGVTFTNPDDSGVTEAVIINSTVGGTSDGGVTLSDVTFDGEPDSADGFRDATAVNVTSSVDSNLQLTIEGSTFDGFRHGINTTVGIDTATIENNQFSDAEVYVQDSTLGLNSIFSNNDFSNAAFAINEDTDGEIRNAIYGDLDRGLSEGDINATSEGDTITVAGEHTDVGTAVELSDNSTTLQSADQRDAIIAGPGGSGLVNISNDNIGDNPVDTVTISGITLQPESDVNGINTTTGDGLIDLTVTDNTFELSGNSHGIDAEGSAQGEDIVDLTISNNEFARASEDTAYDGAIDIENYNLNDDGDVVSADISDNNINNADNGINVSADDGTADNLELDIDGNRMSLVENNGVGINLTVTSASEALVDGNTILGATDGSNAIGLNLTSTTDEVVELTNNEISGIEDSDSDAGTGLKISGFDTNDVVTVENNELTDNSIHIDVTDTDNFDTDNIDSLVSNQETVSNDVRVYTAGDGNNRVDDISEEFIFGTINSTLATTGTSEVVSVGEGTYEETQIVVDEDVRIESAGSAENTVLISDEDERFVNVTASESTIDGLAFESSDDSDNADILVSGTSGNGVTISNSIFVGPGTDNRQAIRIDESDGNPVTVSDNEISGYAVGVNVQDHGDADLNIVRNVVTNNDEGINLGDNNLGGGASEASLNFNDIANNNVGLSVANVNYNHVNATAVWWGDDTGPSGEDGDANEYAGEGDEIVDDYTGGGTNASNFLSESSTNLPESGYVVIPDPTDVKATGSDVAEVVIATLDDTEASDEASGSTNLLFPGTPGGTLTKTELRGSNSVSAANPNVYGITTEESGEYTLRAQHNDGDVEPGEAVQTITGTVSDIDITADSDQLVADDEDTVNFTMQVTDGELDISEADRNVDFLISAPEIDSGNITRESQDSQTDANGQATLTLSAAAAGGSITVTGQDTSTSSTGDVTIDVVEPATSAFVIDEVTAPSSITQNTSATVDATISNTGNASATQTVSYELLADGSVTPAIEKSQDVTIAGGETETVTFDLTAQETDSLETGDYEHIVSTDEDEVTTATSVTSEVEAALSLELVDGPTQVTQNESYSATVNVTNNGGASGTQTVDYALEDDSTGDAAVTDSQDVTVDAGATEQVTFDVAASDTQSIAAGEYTHVISTDGADDATLGVTITVEDEQTVNVGGEDVPVEFTTTENGETTVTPDNAVSAIDAFVAGDIDADTAVSVIDAFIASRS